ncbi:hypothetical protein EUX98_g7925 [Antrodiella citrinella]|uniref:Uncharacterized protein n=1 Tax=Antrodiella citrinella TaxID=2447956 RepID=A0A4S4MED9_9APHY|nr:hypothetical protein EUX98_g7925 [Antrodiella citrinella]
MSITPCRSNDTHRPAGRGCSEKVRFVSCGPQVSFEDPISSHPCDDSSTSARLTKRYTPNPYIDDAIEKYFKANFASAPSEENVLLPSHDSQPYIFPNTSDPLGVWQSQSAIIADWEVEDKVSRATFFAAPSDLEKSQSAVVTDWVGELEPRENVLASSRSVNVIDQFNPFSFADDGFEKFIKASSDLDAAPADSKPFTENLVAISENEPELQKSQLAMIPEEDEIEPGEDTFAADPIGTRKLFSFIYEDFGKHFMTSFTLIAASAGSQSSVVSLVAVSEDEQVLHESPSVIAPEADEIEPCEDTFTSPLVTSVQTRKPFSFTYEGFRKCFKDAFTCVGAPADSKPSEGSLIITPDDLEKSQPPVVSDWERELEAFDSDVFIPSRSTKRAPFPCIDAAISGTSKATPVTSPLDLLEFYKGVSAMISGEYDFEDVVVNDWEAADEQWF